MDEGGQHGVALQSCTQHHRQQHAEGEEEQIGRHEGHAVAAHVLLGIAQRLTGEVLLHHVLIQSCHHDGDEGTTQELFPEVVGRHPVVEDEDTAHGRGGDGIDGFTHGEVQVTDHREDDHDEGREETDGLEGIRKHQCADATTTGVEPDEGHHQEHVHEEGDAHGVEDKLLEDDTHHVEPHGGTRHLRQEEEGGPRQIGPFPEPLPEVAVDGGEVQTVVERQQHEGDGEIAHDESEAHLQIGHLRRQHHARHRDEGDT